MVGSATFSTVLSMPITTTHSDSTHSVHQRRDETGSVEISTPTLPQAAVRELINYLVETGVYCVDAERQRERQKREGTMAKTVPRPTRVRDPEGTRRKILAAALQEFSAKGIDGARVDAIAARARVNKQLLYYYFDSKDGLFRAVLRERLAERAPERPRSPTGPAPPGSPSCRTASPGSGTGSGSSRGRRSNAPVAGRSSRRPAARRSSSGSPRSRKPRPRARFRPTSTHASSCSSELGTVLFPLAFPQLTRLVTGQAPTSPEFLSDRRSFLVELGALLVVAERGGPTLPPRSGQPVRRPRKVKAAASCSIASTVGSSSPRR